MEIKLFGQEASVTERFWSGNFRLVERMVEDYEKSGKSSGLFWRGKYIAGGYSISDKIKDTSRQAVKQLKESGKYN